MSLKTAHRALAAFVCAGLAFGSAVARAQSDAEGEALLAEPIAYTDVIDAFDENDPLDVNVGLRYVRTDQSATISRELVDASAQRTRMVDVASHELHRNELVLELEVGLWRDIMLTLRLPLVLGEEQELRPLSGNACTGSNQSDACRALLEPGTGGEPLIDLAKPIVSARRSGLPNVELGLGWALLDQWRTPELPTWVLRVAGTIDTGPLRSACRSGEGCDPGIARGTSQLTFETRVSRRSRYLEPYLGVSHTLEWVTSGEALFYPSEDRSTAVRAEPPSTTEATLGTAVIPWEDRPRQQRFEIDLQGHAATVGSGQDMTPLFDALGTSTSPYLGAEAGGASAKLGGVTQVEAHARLGFDLVFLMQAAQYVRFTLGAGLTHVTPHLLTGARPCNTEVPGRPTDSRVGSCAVGLVNPLYRAVIDEPGQRFRIHDALALRLHAGAAGRF